MITIAIITNKGGEGKTTTTFNLGAALAKMGKRVLLVDLDSQANLTTSFKLNEKNDQHIGRVMIGEKKAVDILHKTNVKLMDLLPSSKALTAYDLNMTGYTNREGLLRKALKPLKDHYDVCLIDCPPELKILAANALTASQFYLIPFQSKIYSHKGVESIIDFAGAIQDELNENLKLAGIFFNIYNPKIRGTLKENIATKMRSSDYGTKVFNTYIRKNVSLEECILYGQSIFEYAPESDGAADFLALAKELQDRINLN